MHQHLTATPEAPPETKPDVKPDTERPVRPSRDPVRQPSPRPLHRPGTSPNPDNVPLPGVCPIKEQESDPFSELVVPSVEQTRAAIS